MEIKTTGMIFSGNHSRLILDGTISMTRRTWGLEMVNQFPDDWQFIRMEGNLAVFLLLKKHGGKIVPARSYSREIRGEEPNLEFLFKCPYGQVGDQLWVRETWDDETGMVLYKADCSEVEAKEYAFGWKPSIYMFRNDSRITLGITEIRAERLQEITEEDALAEGIKIMQGTWQAMGRSETGRPILIGEPQPYTARYHFEALWDSLNAKRGYGWEVNPWIWCISFRLLDKRLVGDYYNANFE